MALSDFEFENNYLKKLAKYTTESLDSLKDDSNFNQLKVEYLLSIENASQNLVPIDANFYSFVSNFLSLSLKNFFICNTRHNENVQLYFKFYTKSGFVYNETFCFSPLRVLFFSRTQEELNYLSLNFRFTTEENDIISGFKNHDFQWKKVNNTYYRYTADGTILSFSFVSPNLIPDHTYTVSSEDISDTNSNQPIVLNRFNNKNLVQTIASSRVKISPSCMKIRLNRRGIPVTLVSPSKLNDVIRNPLSISSSEVTIPFTFNHNGESYSLIYFAGSPNGTIVLYYIAKSTQQVSEVSFSPGIKLHFNRKSIFNKIPITNIININYMFNVDSIFGFCQVLCNIPTVFRNNLLLNNLTSAESNSTSAGSTTALTTVNASVTENGVITNSSSIYQGLIMPTYDFSSSGNTNPPTPIPADNVLTIIGDCYLTFNDENTSTPLSSIDYLMIGGGASGGIYLDSFSLPPGKPYESGTCEPGGGAGGIAYGTINFQDTTTPVTVGCIIGEGGKYFTVNGNPHDRTIAYPSGAGKVSRLGFVIGNVDSEDAYYSQPSQTGDPYYYQEGMQGGLTQLDIIVTDPINGRYETDGCVNAYGGQPGNIAITGSSTNADQPTLWQTNNNTNSNQSIYGSTLFLNYDSVLDVNNITSFSSVSNSYYESNSVTIKASTTAYFYPLSGLAGGSIFYNGTNIQGDAGLAGGYRYNGAIEITPDTLPKNFNLKIHAVSNGVSTTYNYPPPFGGGGGAGNNVTGVDGYTVTKINNGPTTGNPGVSIYGGGPGSYYQYYMSNLVTNPLQNPLNGTSYGGGGGGACGHPTDGGNYFNFSNNNYFTCGFGANGVIILTLNE